MQVFRHNSFWSLTSIAVYMSILFFYIYFKTLEGFPTYYICAYASSKQAFTPVIGLWGGHNKTPNYYYRDVD